MPGAGGAAETIRANAKVLRVDPSYRLLSLQYPDGRAETFKVGLDVKLLEMQPGDDVVVRNIEEHRRVLRGWLGVLRDDAVEYAP